MQFVNLMEAVYKQAVKDDIAQTIRLAMMVYKPKGTPRYVYSSPKILFAYEKPFKKHAKQRVPGLIKNSIAKESQEWGSRETVQMQLKGIRCAAETVIGGYDERYMYVKKSDKALKKSV